MEAGVLEDVAPGAGLDDSGPEDAGLDDSVLEDAGLDDPGLDDSGLDDPAALVDGMLDDVTVEAALDEVADAVLEAAGAVAAVELLEATPFELELHAVSSAQAAARATRPFVLFIRVPYFFLCRARSPARRSWILAAPQSGFFRRGVVLRAECS